MCEQIEGQSLNEIMEIGDYILKRNANWIEICKNVTAGVEYVSSVNISSVAKTTRKAFDYGMYGDYSKAVEAINCLVHEESNGRLRGYYKQVLAEYTNFVDKSEAQQILKSAKADNIEVLNPIEGIQFIRDTKELPEQSRSIIDNINKCQLNENKLILYVDDILDDLKFAAGTSKKFENAIKEIFVAIGYAARQPEREVGKGPDDFVILGSGNYFVIECKNETTTDTINKHDCNQLNGSFMWFNNLYQDEQVNCTPIMIHNSKVFNFECSPHSDIRIMTPELLEKFKKNVRDFMVAVCQKNNFKNTEKINTLIRGYKLNKEVLVEEYTTLYYIKGR